MKRKIISGAVIAICLAMIGFGTLAYFTAEDTARNVITSGNIEIELLEWADTDRTEPFPKNGVTGVMPGTEVTKMIEVKNTGDNDAYVRVAVGETVIFSGESEARPDDVDYIKPNFDTTKWTFIDGYYYYNETLAAGETTTPLFSTVTFDKDMGNDYQNSTVNIEVNAYATQVKNNGTDAQSAQW